ncbi:hypothetical protein IKW75_03330 [Candidatus Saccharibacteria bacterium]|nr:hypothetical protein [Candidatus Saccharibacteria bacterium]
MKNLRENLRGIYREHRGLFIMMIGVMLVSFLFLIFSLATLSPSSAIVKTGYSDIGSFAGDDLTGMRSAGGYRDGAWGAMFVFPILAVIIGVLHNLIAVRLCNRRGEGAAKAFLSMSLAILIGALIVLIRLLGEG